MTLALALASVLAGMRLQYSYAFEHVSPYSFWLFLPYLPLLAQILVRFLVLVLILALAQALNLVLGWVWLTFI
jgi:hypothetical protein